MVFCDDAEQQREFDGESLLDFNLEHRSSGVALFQCFGTGNSQTGNWSDDTLFQDPSPNIDTPNHNFFHDSSFSSGVETGADQDVSDFTSRFYESASDFESGPEFKSKFKSKLLFPPGATYILPEHGLAPSSNNATPVTSVKRRKISTRGRPRIVHDRKASLIAGMAVSSSESCVDLENIVIQSDDDEMTTKRKKNTVAARRSRARKRETLSAMSKEIKRLRQIIEALGADPENELAQSTTNWLE